MQEFVKSFKVGNAQISVINIGDIYLPLAEHMNINDTELVSQSGYHEFANQTRIPINFVHIQLAEISALVDSGIYDVVTEPEYSIQGYEPPVGLVERLNELGIRTEEIDHVIITHRHWDHFNGTTVEVNGKYVPQYSKARYYLGKAEWECIEKKIQDSETVEFRTLGVLNNLGILELVEGDIDIEGGISIIAAPGETPGHQIVRVQSEGETLYCMGDLYHHPVEFSLPELKVSWANKETIMPSRQALIKRAIDERALLVATHIPAVGRLHQTPNGVTWKPVY